MLGAARAMGGKGAIVVDIDPVKREAARKAGAQAVIDGNAADAAKQIIEATRAASGQSSTWSALHAPSNSASTASSRAAR